MLTRQELEKSPLFADISYEDYLRIVFRRCKRRFVRMSSSMISPPTGGMRWGSLSGEKLC